MFLIVHQKFVLWVTVTKSDFCRLTNVLDKEVLEGVASAPERFVLAACALEGLGKPPKGMISVAGWAEGIVPTACVPEGIVFASAVNNFMFFSISSWES